jgi:hypothetical protein
MLLIDQFRNGPDNEESLKALLDSDNPRLGEICREALHGPPSGATSAALEAIDAWEDPKWCGEVDSLMERVDPNDDLPSPYIWLKCARFLLRHRHTVNIKDQIHRVESQCLGEVAILTLEFFPDIAIKTFRRALRSEIPCNRATAAAALAVIDNPWSRMELAAVLATSTDHVMTTECRSALLTTHTIESHEIVAEWEQRNPRQSEDGPYITMDEMSLRSSDSWIQWEMGELHDRVFPLRSVAPDEPK